MKSKSILAELGLGTLVLVTAVGLIVDSLPLMAVGAVGAAFLLAADAVVATAPAPPEPPSGE
jgi:hypothetical protein